MRLKPGVRLVGVKPELLVGLMIADAIFSEHKEQLVLTSLVDGAHSPGSLHYPGMAFDVRTAGVPQDTLNRIVARLNEELGEDFDVVLELDHLHIEFQPKRRAS